MCMNNGFGGNCCLWIILILILVCCCGNNGFSGCCDCDRGCRNDDCC